MLIRMLSLSTIAAALVAIGLVAGCSQNEQANTDVDAPDEQAQNDATPDPHDVPLTEEEIAQLKQHTAQYDSAIEHIQQYQATIQQETTGGEPAKAHRALDNLDVVLEHLPEAARDSGVPKEKWQTVNETAQKLRDLFNQVHANIDAGTDPNYEAVADEIDQGIQTLAAIEPDVAE